MNIVYGKIGKSINFNKNRWNVTGGDIEAPTLLLRMSIERPDDTFYILSPNDFSKWEHKHKYPNIISLIDGYSGKFDDHTYIVNKIQNMGLKIDGGIFYNGICGQRNIADGDYLKQNGTIAPIKILEYAKRYVSNIFHYLNEMKPPYILLVPDPRYFPLAARDLFHKPIKVMSQYTSTEVWKTMNKMTREVTESPITQEYSEIETICYMGWKKMPEKFVNKPRERKFTIILNEGKYIKQPRGAMLDEYLFNQFPKEDLEQVEVYGIWTEPYSSMSQFKGGMSIEKLFGTLTNTRYTLCIPIEPGWVTAKVAEMIHFGIIPFLHHTYDEQNHLPIPEFIRCKNAIDFKQKVQILEDNPELREQLQRDLWNIYSAEEYYTGRKIINNMMNTIYEHNQLLRNETI